MNDVVFRAEGLGEKYVIGHQAPTERHRTLRDAIGSTLDNFTRSGCDMAAGRQLVTAYVAIEVTGLIEARHDP